MSGPPAMVDAAKQSFVGHGLDPAHLYYDSFDFAPDSQPKPGQ
jgi:CDP-4-dehydro-6-deoxyglucose reductase